MAAVGGTGIGGGQSKQAYEMAYNAPIEELNKTPAYQAAYWKIADTYKAEGTEAHSCTDRRTSSNCCGRSCW